MSWGRLAQALEKCADQYEKNERKIVDHYQQRRAVSATHWREHFSDKLKNALFIIYKIFPLPEEKNKDIIYHNYRNTACREMDLKVRKRQKRTGKRTVQDSGSEWRPSC